MQQMKAERAKRLQAQKRDFNKPRPILTDIRSKSVPLSHSPESPPSFATSSASSPNGRTTIQKRSKSVQRITSPEGSPILSKNKQKGSPKHRKQAFASPSPDRKTDQETMPYLNPDRRVKKEQGVQPVFSSSQIKMTYLKSKRAAQGVRSGLPQISKRGPFPSKGGMAVVLPHKGSVTLPMLSNNQDALRLRLQEMKEEKLAQKKASDESALKSRIEKSLAHRYDALVRAVKALTDPRFGQGMQETRWRSNIYP